MYRLQELKTTLNKFLPALELREQEPMSRHTTFRVGGPATLMALPKDSKEAEQVVRTAFEMGIQPVFVGNGSNLLVSDTGIDGFVVKASDGLNTMHLDGNRITVGSGALLSRLAVFAQEHGLAGLAFAHGIPGSVGGAVTMNAGAYGGEMKQVVEQVVCLDENGARMVLSGEECEFSYRHSAFANEKRMILSVTFKLEPGNPSVIRAEMDELMAKRREKQPLEYPSAGSTFKRPEGHFAAALIDQCGLKGLAVGGAQVSEKHAGFIVNRGGATCADVVELIEQVRKQVFDRTGVMLEPEVKFVGG